MSWSLPCRHTWSGEAVAVRASFTTRALDPAPASPRDFGPGVAVPGEIWTRCHRAGEIRPRPHHGELVHQPHGELVLQHDGAASAPTAASQEEEEERSAPGDFAS